MTTMEAVAAAAAAAATTDSSARPTPNYVHHHHHHELVPNHIGEEAGDISDAARDGNISGSGSGGPGEQYPHSHPHPHPHPHSQHPPHRHHHHQHQHHHHHHHRQMRPIRFPAGNDDFRAARSRCALACRRFNETAEDAPPAVRSSQWLDIVRPGRDRTADGRSAVTHDMTFRDPQLKAATPFVKPPFFADYGLRLRVGGSTFINRDCKVLDTPVADVVIGEGCDIGPNCCIVSVCHAVGAEARVGAGARRMSLGLPVSVGDNVWIGANVTILGGVTIGSGAVIGAGSLVTRDIPPNSVACGVPARVTRAAIDDIGRGAATDADDDDNTVETLRQALRLGKQETADGDGDDVEAETEAEEMDRLFSNYLSQQPRSSARNLAPPPPAVPPSRGREHRGGSKADTSPAATSATAAAAAATTERARTIAALVTILSLVAGLTGIFLANVVAGAGSVARDLLAHHCRQQQQQMQQQLQQAANFETAGAVAAAAAAAPRFT